MSNPYPEITFEVDLTLLKSEDFGPATNESSVGVHHPDFFQNDANNGHVERNRRTATRSTWNPGLAGVNQNLKHGDQFTLYGLNAIYVRDMYAVGYAPTDRAVLNIV
jgi:hypothetical protein